MAARRKSGFTLIELLVVIAIIAILAAILFPVFARARETARKSTCTNNIKECALAINVYMGDFDSTLPSSAIVAGTGAAATKRENFCCGTGGGAAFPVTGARVSWAQAIYDQMKSKDIMFCPSDSAKDAPTQLSYWWKTAFDDAWNNAASPAKKESDYAYGSAQIVLYECKAFHSGDPALSDGVQINVAYLDNHAKTVALKQGSGLTAAGGIGSAGEPMYFCYDEVNGRDLTKGTNANPRQQSDNGM